MTQKDLLESVLTELKHIKTHMPNGELKQMQKDMENLKEDVSDLKYTLLNPENGVIVNTNKNTEFRREREGKLSYYENEIVKLNKLVEWQKGVSKALWIIFTVLAGILFKFFIETQS